MILRTVLAPPESENHFALLDEPADNTREATPKQHQPNGQTGPMREVDRCQHEALLDFLADESLEVATHSVPQSAGKRRPRVSHQLAGSYLKGGTRAHSRAGRSTSETLEIIVSSGRVRLLRVSLLAR